MTWFACECRNHGPLAIEAEEAPNCGQYGDYDLRSVLHKPFATEAEAMAHFGTPVLYCRECGHRINLRYIEPCRTQLIERALCFGCDFWTQKIGESGIIIDGRRYSAGSNRKPGPFNGFGGSWFHIRMNTGAEIHTCDLWAQGEIPERFRDRLPDNATFMNGAKWVKVGDTWCMDNPRVEATQ